MGTELVVTHKFRKKIPDAHRSSIDTRIQWLWHQRFGTVQTVWQESKDALDHTACTLILQAIMGHDLESISQILQRIEGGSVRDTDEAEKSKPLRV